jgi:hypothetical protein
VNFIWRALPIAATFAIAAILARLLLANAPAHLATDLAQPVIVVTNWGRFGAALLGVLLAALAIGAIAYRRAIGCAGASSPLGITIATGVALVAAWCMPVLFSSDLYAYAAYGELTRLGHNPYAHSELNHANALISAAAWQWGKAIPVCVYGPAFVALALAVVTVLAPLGTLAQLEGMRVVASAALMLCIPLAYAAFPGDRTRRLAATAAIGLNPAAIWCAVEGHNDAIALAVALMGFALVRRRLFGIGAAIVALSGLVKAPGAAAAIALAAVERRARAGAVAGIALFATLSLPLLVSLVSQMAPHGQYAPQASLQAAVAPIALLVLGNQRWASLAALLIAAGVCALLARAGVARLRRRADEGWIWLGLAAWVLIPNPYPWYGLWLVALAGLAVRSRAGSVAIALSLTAALRYVPDAIAVPGPPGAVALGVLAMLPLVGLLAPINK